MRVPRFYFEEDADDATTPAQFVLKLPESYAQRLAALSSPTHTPSVPWIIDAPKPSAPAWSELKKLVVVAACTFVGIIIVAVGVSVTSASSSGDGPVGISHRAPKKLEKVVRAADRHHGFAPQAAAVSIETLHRSHARRGRR